MIKAADSRFRAVSADPSSFGLDLAALGRQHSTVFDEHMGALLVLRHQDVSAALRNHGTFSTSFYGVGPMASMMIAHGGAEHTPAAAYPQPLLQPGGECALRRADRAHRRADFRAAGRA